MANINEIIQQQLNRAKEQGASEEQLAQLESQIRGAAASDNKGLETPVIDPIDFAIPTGSIEKVGASIAPKFGKVIVKEAPMAAEVAAKEAALKALSQNQELSLLDRIKAISQTPGAFHQTAGVGEKIAPQAGKVPVYKFSGETSAISPLQNLASKVTRKKLEESEE